MTRFRILALAALLLTFLPRLAPPTVADPAPETPPHSDGPFLVQSCTWLGGPFNDEIVATAIAPDGSIVLAGNSPDITVPGVTPKVLGDDAPLPVATPPVDAKAARGWRHPGTCGFVLLLAPGGQKALSLARFGHGVATIKRMKLDAAGAIYLVGTAPSGIHGMAGSTGTGDFVARLDPDATRVVALAFIDRASDLGVDSNGDVVVLGAGPALTRYASNLRDQKWSVKWSAYGDNRSGAMALSPQTGVTAVVGYGMTRTGHEPYKDPYAYGFDRDGKQIWSLWNPDPKLEAGAQYGGNGLMADTTGHVAGVDNIGKLYLMLYADGGNSICTRDPLDPSKPLDPSVLDGTFQKTAGFGFKGASKTSVIFRVDPLTGHLEKGTWMTAWLTPARANGLSIDGAVGYRDPATTDSGYTFVVGGSSQNAPVKAPWYEAVEGGYKGGGFLAILDRGFKMQQCGYFPGADIGAVDYRDGTVVIAGSAKQDAPVYKPLQNSFGGGEKDGYVVVLKVK